MMPLYSRLSSLSHPRPLLLQEFRNSSFAGLRFPHPPHLAFSQVVKSVRRPPRESFACLCPCLAWPPCAFASSSALLISSNAPASRTSKPRRREPQQKHQYHHAPFPSKNQQTAAVTIGRSSSDNRIGIKTHEPCPYQRRRSRAYVRQYFYQHYRRYVHVFASARSVHRTLYHH